MCNIKTANACTFSRVLSKHAGCDLKRLQYLFFHAELSLTLGHYRIEINMAVTCLTFVYSNICVQIRGRCWFAKPYSSYTNTVYSEIKNITQKAYF